MRLGFRFWAVIVIVGGSCNQPSSHAAIEVDPLFTVNLQVGGNVVATGRLEHCRDARAVVAKANGVEVARDDAPILFLAELPDADPAEAEAPRFQIAIPAAELPPTVFGLPVVFDLELSVRCHRERVHSLPFAMTYLPTLESFVPPFRPARFWPGDSQGDFWVCEDTRLSLYAQGVDLSHSVDVGFPCATSDLSDGIGVRRYLTGDALGIAALDYGLALAWTRPFKLVTATTDVASDPVVLREEAAETVVVVLDAATGADKVGPLYPSRPAVGRLARDATGDILVLTMERVDSPAALSYYVQRFSASGSDLGEVMVAHYDWRAPTYVAEFSKAGDAIYVAVAPVDDTSVWVEKVDLVTGAVLWFTPTTAGWRYPLGEAAGRAIVASKSAFIWLDLHTGAEVSAAFAPDSGNQFLRGVVEADGSVVMLADVVASLAQGLYIFAPDGRSTLRFHPSAALFRWLAPAWANGTLVSFFSELHWLPARQAYDDMAGF